MLLTGIFFLASTAIFLHLCARGLRARTSTDAGHEPDGVWQPRRQPTEMRCEAQAIRFTEPGHE